MDDTVDPRLPDSELVRRIRGGDNRAETELYERHKRSVLSMLQERTRNLALAADLCQQTFLTVLKKLREQDLQKPASVLGYLHQTAKFLALNARRKFDDSVPRAGGNLLQQLMHEGDGPARQLQRAQVERILRALLQAVHNDRDREILLRYYVHEQDKAQITAAMRLTPDQVDRVLSRARKRFKQKLLDASIDPDDLWPWDESD
jgi:RNA polymerase sigma-70 factor, ECF subfamily